MGMKKDVTDWDSNYGESTQMLLKKTQIKTCCIIHRRGEGNLSAFQYKLLRMPMFNVPPLGVVHSRTEPALLDWNVEVKWK